MAEKRNLDLLHPGGPANSCAWRSFNFWSWLCRKGGALVGTPSALPSGGVLLALAWPAAVYPSPLLRFEGSIDMSNMSALACRSRRCSCIMSIRTLSLRHLQ
jgi:hypothetical protein